MIAGPRTVARSRRAPGSTTTRPSMGEPTGSPPAPGSELGHAVVLRVGHRREEDQRLRAVLAEGGDEVVDATLQEVVAEVHDERGVAQVRLGGEHRVREARGLVLDDVLELDPP